MNCRSCEWPLASWSMNWPHVPGCDGGTLTTPCDCDLGPLCRDCFIAWAHEELPGQTDLFDGVDLP